VKYRHRVPSAALADWNGQRQTRIAELLAAHATIGGSGRGRRWRTSQLNWALTLRLAGEFQGYARDLHSLAVTYFADSVAQGNRRLGNVLQVQFTTNRALDRGNATPSSLGSDFGRLGLELWPVMRVASPHAQSWQDGLEALNRARNAIAHANQDDLDRLARDGYPIVMQTIKRWHRTLDLLAGTMDDVVADYLDGLLRTGRPW
jgi:hypothetical protein